MKRGQRVLVCLPVVQSRKGTLTTGKLCGRLNMSYRVKIDGLVTPWTVSRNYIKVLSTHGEYRK